MSITDFKDVIKEILFLKEYNNDLEKRIAGVESEGNRKYIEDLEKETTYKVKNQKPTRKPIKNAKFNIPGNGIKDKEASGKKISDREL